MNPLFKTLNLLRPLLQHIPTGIKSCIRRKLLNSILSNKLDYPRIEKSPQLKEGVNLIGFPFRCNGIGQQLRYYANYLLENHIPFIIYDYDNLVHFKENPEFIRLRRHLNQKLQYPTNIWCFNFHNMRFAFYEKGKTFFENYYNIGYFPWEYEQIPQQYIPDLELCDEIWGISNFVSNIIGKYVNMPIKTVNIPVKLHVNPKYNREYFMLPKNTFVFMFIFDFNSSYKRKNPQAIVKAFQQAFLDKKKYSNIQLIFKTHKPSILSYDYLKGSVSSFFCKGIVLVLYFVYNKIKVSFSNV